MIWIAAVVSSAALRPASKSGSWPATPGCARTGSARQPVISISYLAMKKLVGDYISGSASDGVGNHGPIRPHAPIPL